MTMYATIYKATNIITNQHYIGFTLKSLEERKTQHQRRMKNNNNIKFYNSLRKYGWNNFEWNIVYQSKDLTHCLDIMEPFFIEEFDSFNNGLNSTKGGEGNLGWKPTPEQNKKNSEAIRKLYSNPNSVYNSKEYKDKFKKSMNSHEYKMKVSGKNNTLAKPVIDPNGNIYDTITEASISKKCHTTTIRRWCQTNRNGWSFYTN